MERIELYRDGRVVGDVTMEPVGNRMEVRASLPNPGDGLYRLVLLGDVGELPLGVMEPEGGTLRLCRRPYRRDLAAVGHILGGEARRSFAFTGGKTWRRAERPTELFRSRWLQAGLENRAPVLWRRAGGLLCIALPYDGKQPFPLVELFCLARLERIDGKSWVTYAFDREEQPVCPEKT